MVNITDVFIGTKQSKFAGIAIFLAIIVVCISILFTNTDISLGKRFSIVLFIILASIPSVFLSLFELSCIVTGGSKTKNQWCYYFAWFIAVIIIIYCIIIIISGLMSMFTYNSAMEKVKDTEQNKRLSKEDANTIAVNMITYDSQQNTTLTKMDMSPVAPPPVAPSQASPVAPPQAPSQVPPSTKPMINDKFAPEPNVSSFQSNYLELNNSQKVPSEASFNSQYDHPISQTKPTSSKPQWMTDNIKPIVNNQGSESGPAPYINENFASY